MSGRRLGPLVLLGAVLGAVAPARSARFPVCTGRFVAPQGSLVVGSTVVSDTVTVEGARPRFTVALTGTCPSVRAKVKGTKGGTKVSCTWTKTCGLTTNVKLKGLILPGCETMTGIVKTGRTIVPFTAS